MSDFTPGPWAVHPQFPCSVVVATDVCKSLGGSADPDREAVNNAKVICHQRGSDIAKYSRSRVMSEEAKANALLIAQAPAMFDFIATLENDDGKIPDWLWEKRNEILAKATGKEK